MALVFLVCFFQLGGSTRVWCWVFWCGFFSVGVGAHVCMSVYLQGGLGGGGGLLSVGFAGFLPA